MSFDPIFYSQFLLSFYSLIIPLLILIALSVYCIFVACMALMRLGSKSEAFHRQGQTWLCSTGLQSDITIQIGEMSFNLHKFPLLSRSGLLEKLIEELPEIDGSARSLNLDDMPGGAKAFELVSKFCYGVKLELTALNIVSIRCAAEYLRMTEEYGEGNLIVQSEMFLNEVFGIWEESLKALETCEEVLIYAEQLHIVSRCIDSLAIKACVDPTVFNLPPSGQLHNNNSQNESTNVVVWNGIAVSTKPEQIGDDWWYEDVSFLNLPLYKQFIIALESKGMKPENISASLIYYAKKYLPSMNRQSSFNASSNHLNHIGGTVSCSSEADQRNLLEEIVNLLPYKKGVTSPKFLLRLLRTAMVLHASPSSRDNLEKRIGGQLDQAVLTDLLIPNVGYSVETLYDIDCVQRILDHFMSLQQDTPFSPCIVEEGQYLGGSNDALTPVTMVASLMDGFLAEIAPDVNLKLPKFELIAATIPDYARPVNDGVYRAVDVYLKAHAWLTDLEREQLCRLVNCQKLSLEASTHAAQNERLPLRVIVQVLFFEQLRLRTSVSGWFFVSENLDSQNPSGNMGFSKKNDSCQEIDVTDRVSELEKECSNMKEELQKLMKSKKKWTIFSKRFSFKQKMPPCNSKRSCDLKNPIVSASKLQNHENGDVA